MGRLSGGAPLRYLGSKGIQRGSGETREIWDTRRVMVITVLNFLFFFFFEKLGIFLENFGSEISSIFSITKIVDDDPFCV